MAEHIHKCKSCSIYSLENNCPLCKQSIDRPLPPKFSLEDKYVQYRREVKKKEFVEKGLY